MSRMSYLGRLYAQRMPEAREKARMGVKADTSAVRQAALADILLEKVAERRKADRVLESVATGEIAHDALEPDELAFTLTEVASLDTDSVRESVCARRFGYGTTKFFAALGVVDMARGLVSRPERVIERRG